MSSTRQRTKRRKRKRNRLRWVCERNRRVPVLWPCWWKRVPRHRNVATPVVHQHRHLHTGTGTGDHGRELDHARDREVLPDDADRETVGGGGVRPDRDLDRGHGRRRADHHRAGHLHRYQLVLGECGDHFIF